MDGDRAVLKITLNTQKAGLASLPPGKARFLIRAVTGFTLLELITVIVILVILATVTLPKYGKIKESAIDNEAIANLKLIQAAENAFKIIENQYVSGSDAGALNTILRLALPTTSASLWNYKAEVIDTNTFTAKSRRTSNDSRVKWINQSAYNVSSGGTW